MWPLVLGALTVLARDGCPAEALMNERLAAQGVTAPPDMRLDVTLGREGDVWVATIHTADAAPRRLEHRGDDCGSLADATVALLTVLLDEQVRPAPPPPPPAAAPIDRLRSEVYLATSHGIVAPFAAGVGGGVALRFGARASIGLVLEGWPTRDHPVAGGRVSVSAGTLGVAACAEHRVAPVTFAACALPHLGIYALSAEDYPVVRDAYRPLVAMEANGRVSLGLGRGVGLFVRGGAWLPFTRLDVTVAGSDAGFRTTTFGPKGAIGVELNH